MPLIRFACSIPNVRWLPPSIFISPTGHRFVSLLLSSELLQSGFVACNRSRLRLLRSFKMATATVPEPAPNNSATVDDRDEKLASPSPRIKGIEKNVWVEYTGMARDYKAVNLGQGFPDFAPPDFVVKALTDTVTSDNPLMHQYTRGYGHPRLVAVMAEVFSKLMGQKIDSNTEILITCGAYQSLFCAIHGLVHPGDEVIIIEPYFDCYEPMVRFAGATPVFVPLRRRENTEEQHAEGKYGSSAEFQLDLDELSRAFTPRTRALIINNPNNPLGKVFTQRELQSVADIVKQHSKCVVISDEVYEWLVYKPNKHVRMATLPGMWERTLTIGSAGKTFSVTGWKCGWTIAPAKLLRPSQIVLQNVSYTYPTPIQEAVAIGFEQQKDLIGNETKCYFHQLPAELEPKRDELARALKEVGFVPLVPEGGYFLCAEYAGVTGLPDGEKLKRQENETQVDAAIVKWLIKTHKLALIPMTPFYSAEHKNLGEKYLRFCFIKDDRTLEKAIKILHEVGNDGKTAAAQSGKAGDM